MYVKFSLVIKISYLFTILLNWILTSERTFISLLHLNILDIYKKSCQLSIYSYLEIYILFFNRQFKIFYKNNTSIMNEQIVFFHDITI